jgi:hypothetical protein
MAWTNLGTVAPGDVLRANSGTAAYNNVIGNLNDLGGAWTSYTPTWTNLTVGDSAQDFKYLNAGKLYMVRAKITFASGFSVSSGPEFTLPNGVSFNSGYAATTAVGDALLLRQGVAEYQAFIMPASTLSRARFKVFNSASTYAFTALVGTTVPATWLATDIWSGTFVFEAA